MTLSLLFPPLTREFWVALVWILPLFVVFLFAGLAVIRRWGDNRLVPDGLIAILGLTAFFARLPGILLNKVSNIDEAQTIAHALTLIRSAQPWKSVDFTTNGPLNAYAYFLPHWLGLPKDYLVSHLIVMGLQVIMVVALFKAAQNWWGRSVAALSLLPLLAFLGFAQHEDFTHHSSELWCVVPFSVALACFSGYNRQRPVRSDFYWYVIGFMLGMIPYGKPQGAPPALIAAGLMFIWMVRNLQGQGRRRAILWFIAGGLSMTLLFAFLLYRQNSFTDFYDLYIRANLTYAARHGSGISVVPAFLWGWAVRSDPSAYFWLVAVLCLSGSVVGKSLNSGQKWLGAFLGLIVLGGAYAVQRAGRPFEHYLLLFLFPVVPLLFGWAVARLEKYRHRRQLLAVTFSLFVLYLLFHSRYKYVGQAIEYTEEQPWKLKPSALSEYIRKWASEPEDYLTVYGYYNEIYVDTQLPSAARTVTVYQHSVIAPEIYTPYYCSDLLARKPAVIVDALDVPRDFREEKFVNRQQHAPEKISSIAAFIAENYQLAGVVDRGRVYVRNDRWSDPSKAYLRREVADK